MRKYHFITQKHIEKQRLWSSFAAWKKNDCHRQQSSGSRRQGILILQPKHGHGFEWAAASSARVWCSIWILLASVVIGRTSPFLPEEIAIADSAWNHIQEQSREQNPFEIKKTPFISVTGRQSRKPLWDPAWSPTYSFLFHWNQRQLGESLKSSHGETTSTTFKFFWSD